MSGINISDITSKTLLGATFAQAAYPNTNINGVRSPLIPLEKTITPLRP